MRDGVPRTDSKELFYYLTVRGKGRTWADAEEAYKFYKNGDTPHDEKVMYRIVVAKLRQHPLLLEGVLARGGLVFLEGCDHLVGVRGSRWEGKGLESRFIRVLVAAYKTVTQED